MGKKFVFGGLSYRTSPRTAQKLRDEADKLKREIDRTEHEMPPSMDRYDALYEQRCRLSKLLNKLLNAPPPPLDPATAIRAVVQEEIAHMNAEVRDEARTFNRARNGDLFYNEWKHGMALTSAILTRDYLTMRVCRILELCCDAENAQKLLDKESRRLVETIMTFGNDPNHDEYTRKRYEAVQRLSKRLAEVPARVEVWHHLNNKKGDNT